ncbi:hypothetical protein HDU80_006991, partial [Chytriomyces hyalinus]
MGRKAGMNNRHARMPTIHYLTLKPENVNITKGKYVASRHHYLFDEDGKPVPVEGTELPVFLEDIPGMSMYSTDKGRHLFLEEDTGMFIAYFEADAMQKCFRDLARSIETFECGTRNDIRGSSKRKGHTDDSKMVASGLKPCGERGLCESGVSPYKSAGSFVLSNIARQELAYQLLEVSKRIQWMETVGETERKEVMFKYFYDVSMEIRAGMYKSGMLDESVVPKKSIDPVHLVQVFHTSNYSNRIHEDDDCKRGTHSYGIGYNTMDENESGVYYFVVPEYGLCFPLKDNLYWSWNTSIFHSTSVYPLEKYPCVRYNSVISVSQRLKSATARPGGKLSKNGIQLLQTKS